MDNTILFVDDEPSILSSLTRSLVDEHYKIYTANSGMEGLDILKKHPVKLVISDEKMPEMSGSDFLSAVKNLFPETVRIMLTGHASVEAAMKAVNCGEIYRFLAKPWNEIELKLAIRSAIEKYDLEAENKKLLKEVKRQASELETLEQMHPGITSLKKDSEGNLILPDISDPEEDIARIVSRTEKQFKIK